MARYILAFEIDNAFYQEFSEQGATHEALLEQLRLDIEDQLDEYDFHQLMTDLVSVDNHHNMVILAQKQENEDLFCRSRKEIA